MVQTGALYALKIFIKKQHKKYFFSVIIYKINYIRHSKTFKNSAYNSKQYDMSCMFLKLGK